MKFEYQSHWVKYQAQMKNDIFYLTKTYLKGQGHLNVKVKVTNIMLKRKEINFLSIVNVFVIYRIFLFCIRFTGLDESAEFNWNQSTMTVG